MKKNEIKPSKAEFLATTNKTSIPTIYKEIRYNKPALYYECFRQKNSFLLESIKGSTKIARYSYIGWSPYLIFKVDNSHAKIYTNTGKHFSIVGKTPLSALKSIVTSYCQSPAIELTPFQGGAVGFFSYDFVRFFEKIPTKALDTLRLPKAHFLMVDKLIAFDHKKRQAWLICCPEAQNMFNTSNSEIDWRHSYEQAVTVINDCQYQIDEFLKYTKEPSITKSNSSKVEISYGMSKSAYMDMVKQTLKYIAAGDIFQANLSQRVAANIENNDPWILYKKLSTINPSPFACYFDFGDYSIVSSSPERLVRAQVSNHNGQKIVIADTRPIAGTRPRGKNTLEDERLRSELLINDKERAEHIMLIDLERNDLGKVSDYGTVTVDELMITEDYSHVIHIVSNVAGQLNAKKDCFDLIRAMFPGGTITGVPKVRCMEIIDELEPVVRGPYTGSAGYFGFSGNMDTNIIIRTFVIKDETAYVQAGAGIVADSDPEREYYETLKKAEALIKTLREI
ncbi:MAG: anthranilate synthase component I family protein [Candidatus Magnetoovum sp. WYHC-5]|nr:anthranilate synthase component I family protein [Candidatus Magnetoovum sp. WYHC-5]